MPDKRVAMRIGREPIRGLPRRSTVTPLPIRCARCQQPLTRGQAEEVGEHQATASSLVYVHRGTCPPPQ